MAHAYAAKRNKGRKRDVPNSLRHPITQEIIEPVKLHDDFLGELGVYASLTPQLRAAVDVLVMGGTGTAAARAAGYTTCAPSTQAVHGHLLRKRADVQAAIKEREAFAMEEAGLTPIRSWIETRRIAYFDPKDMLDEKGNMLPIEQMPDDVRAAIQSVEVEETIDEVVGTKKKGPTRVVKTRIAKIKFWNKLDALTMHLKASGQIKTGALEGAVVFNTQVNNNMEASAERVATASPVDAAIEYQQLMSMTPVIEHKP